MLKHTHTYPALVPRPLAAAISDDDHKTFHRPLGLMLPEDAEAELSWPHRAAQKAGTMEQLPALSTVLCTVLLIPIGGAAPPHSQPRQRQPKGQGSQAAAESESLHYAEIKIQTPGRRDHTSNHSQQR
ncbi:uncharacterized protein LOC116822859 isoform X2 [Chelonoidis abingdonii]|uniref:uncharacterized protein LOC116822859 isoform X2 n=1 Tax=Chelonoidis abingdonii TaxID=106734 RepID=UPI003F494DB8